MIEFNNGTKSFCYECHKQIPCECNHQKFRDLYQRQEKLEKRIKELEVDVKNLKYPDVINFPLPKKPHRCPVCDGSTKCHQYDPAVYVGLLPCPACEGKGIVWG